MVESVRKKYENNFVTWLTVIGVPFGVSIAILYSMGYPIKVWLSISILIAFEFGLIAYLIFLKGDIKDLKKNNKNLITENRRLKKRLRQLE